MLPQLDVKSALTQPLKIYLSKLKNEHVVAFFFYRQVVNHIPTEETLSAMQFLVLSVLESV